MKLLLFCLIIIQNLSAINLGNIATGSSDGIYYKLGNQISEVLNKYDIKLNVINTKGSFENIDILNGHYINNKNVYFAIMQNDVIQYYNYIKYSKVKEKNKKKLLTLISLGSEQIHLYTLKNKEINLNTSDKYNVYCGSKDSGACVSAKYIQKAYNFNFKFINIKKENILNNLKSGKIDFVVDVIETTSKRYKNNSDIKFLSLEDNSLMDNMYKKDIISKNSYSYMDNDIQTYSVFKILVTNLHQKKYIPIIKNIVKILIINKKDLENKYPKQWENIDFKYTHFKNMSKVTKKIINNYIK